MKNIKKYEEFKLDEGILGNIYSRAFRKRQIDEVVNLAVKIIISLSEIASTINSSNKLTKEDEASLFETVKSKFLNSIQKKGVVTFTLTIHEEGKSTLSNYEPNKLKIFIEPLEDFSGLMLLSDNIHFIYGYNWYSDVKVMKGSMWSSLRKLYGINQIDGRHKTSNAVAPDSRFSSFTPNGILTDYPILIMTKDGLKYNSDLVRSIFLTCVMRAYMISYLSKIGTYSGYSTNILNLDSIINLLSKTQKYIVTPEEEKIELILDLFELKYSEYFKQDKSSKLPTATISGICSLPATLSCASTIATSPSPQVDKTYERGFILDLISIIELIDKPFDYLIKIKDYEKVLSEVAKESPKGFDKVEQSLPPEYRHKAGISKDLGDLGF